MNWISNIFNKIILLKMDEPRDRNNSFSEQPLIAATTGTRFDDKNTLLKANELRSSSISSVDDREVHETAVRKLKLRVLPIMFLLSLISYLDRTNLAFVATKLETSLNINDTQYSLGAGFFFATYATMQIPANFLLKKVGAVTWISSLAVAWGLSTLCMAFVVDATSFYLVRALLGLAEAGFYPGLIMYLRSFFGVRDFGFAYAVTLSATSIALAAGGPIIAGIEWFSEDFFPHYEDWKFCFIVQGGLAIVCGVLLILFQPRKIESCGFLSEEEKTVEMRMVREVEGETKKVVENAGAGAAKTEAVSGKTGAEAEAEAETEAEELGFIDATKAILTRTSVMYCYALVWFMISLPYWGFIYFVPKIIEEIEDGSVSETEVLMLSSYPYSGAVFGNLLIAKSASYFGPHTRHFHFILAMGLAVLGFGSASVFEGKTAKITGLTIAGAGLWGQYGPLWSLVTEEAVASKDKGTFVAAVNGLGNVGGFIGPYVITLFATKEASYIFFCVMCTFCLVPFNLALQMSKSGLERFSKPWPKF